MSLYKTIRAQLVNRPQGNRLGLIAILISWLAFFSRTIFGQKIYFLDDLKIIYYPLEFVYSISQNSGHLPVWSNEFGFGHPLIAWAQLGFFTPLHLVLRFLQFHPLTLLQISIVFYFGLGLLGMYMFLRARHVTQYAAALGSIVFTFSGFHVGHLNHVNFYTTTMWLPWLLLILNFYLSHPTILKMVSLSLIGGAMALSGQPQVVLYSFIIAVTYSLVTIVEIGFKKIKSRDYKYFIRLSALSLIAISIAISISSFAILPLFEFLHLTDRASGVPPQTLYEFSYPVWNTITLISPYFFGDHSTYWGPKGFQELAAFTGIIPLLLAGAALVSWRTYRREKIVALLLIVISIVFALGKYSPVYSLLVENHVITSLSIPGRFVFFFTTGISLLAAISLAGLSDGRRQSRKIVAGLLFTSLLILPFVLKVLGDDFLRDRALGLLSVNNIELYLIILGIGLFLGHVLGWTPLSKAAQPALVVLTSATLIIYSWNFNPLTPANIAYQESPFTDTLTTHQEETGLPARIYARNKLIQSSNKTDSPRRTAAIGPDLSIHQPLHIDRPNLNCLVVPIWQPENPTGSITLSLRENLHAAPLRQETIPTSIITSFDYSWCFKPWPNSKDANVMLSITSDDPTTFQIIAQETNQTAQQAYFVRSSRVTSDIFNKSRKELTISVEPFFAASAEIETALLERHTNVLAGVSSARWIGALSIGDYRDFIERFFANDREPYDGEGRHAITANRKILNMAGITHLSQALANHNDQAMTDHNFSKIQSSNIGHTDAILYKNDQAFPKAFVVPTANFQPAADETRHAMSDNEFDPATTVFLTGPTPPQLPLRSSKLPFVAEANIQKYAADEIVVEVNTTKESVLVVTDATTPQWHTQIDGQPAPHLKANSVFKAAIVLPGKHTVTFTYDSPAIERSIQLTKFGLATCLILIAIALIYTTIRKNNPAL